MKTPPYRLHGGKVVETGWRPWMSRVRDWIETRFSVLVRSFGSHRLENKRFWSLVARVNLIVLAHILVRSRVLLKIAGVELCAKGSKRKNGLSPSLVPLLPQRPIPKVGAVPKAVATTGDRYALTAALLLVPA